MSGTAITIRLTRGYVALVDLDDYEMLSRLKWRAKVEADGRVYASAHLPRSGKRGKAVVMHRYILGVTDPLVKVDHRNGDGLNNTRDNLRICTNAQNVRNQRAHGDKKTSKLKGVSFIRSAGKYRAQIMVNYRKFNLGNFANEIDAAKAYDAAAREHFGEFARCNFGA